MARLLSSFISISRSSKMASTFPKAFFMLSPRSFLGLVIIVSYCFPACSYESASFLEVSLISLNVARESLFTIAPAMSTGPFKMLLLLDKVALIMYDLFSGVIFAISSRAVPAASSPI